MKEVTKEMIELAAKGSQYAIEDLYKLTYRSVYKAAKALIQDEDTVLDIVQDSYVKAFQSLDQLDSPESFRAWIKRIATNKAKDYLKKKKPILFSEMANEDGEEIDFRDECLEHLPDEALDRKETTRLMNEILGTLSEDQRLVLGMHYYEEMSVKEIAQMLGCSENTIKSRLNYGRKKVEVKVKELEKKGTKLYSLAPLPFLLWLFRMDAQAAEIPSATVLEAVTAESAATGTAAAGSAGAAATASGAKAAAGAGAKALTTKIIAGVLAVSVIGGGTMLALSSNDREEAEPTQQIVSTEAFFDTTAPATAETTPPTTEETTIPTTETTDGASTAYEQVMLSFQGAYVVDSHQWISNPDSYHQQYSHLNTAALDSYHQYAQFAPTDFYYAYADLDGNGTDELIISELPQVEPHHRIISVYSFDGTEAVEIIECGNSNTVAICADGSIIVTEGSILEGVSSVCVIGADGVYPEITAQHQYDLYADTYQNGSEVLSSQDYYAKYAANGNWEFEWHLLCSKVE